MRIVVEKGEWCPVYEMYRDGTIGQGLEIELSDQEFERCRAAFREFAETQSLLRRKYYECNHRS